MKTVNYATTARSVGGRLAEMSDQFITKRDEVKSLLRRLFRSEEVDLDFGIYRIMNFKRREIDQFIERDLIEMAEADFKQYAMAGTADLEKELERLKSEINSNFGTRTIDPEGRVTRNHDAPKVQRYIRTQEEYRTATLTEEQINDVFNHIYEFLSRYYNDGDFIVKPRDSWHPKYSIPYKGEEVTLQWATKDMYYVKTGEFFKKYSFKAGRYRINFVIVNAQVETGNAKKDKVFILSDEEPVQIDETAREIEIRFNYRKLTDAEKSKYGTRNIQATLVSDTLEKMGPLLEQSSIVGILRPRSGEEKSLIEKHLNSYVYRNTKDFFIHKNLKEFLERELDFYLKNEVWSLDELESSIENGSKLLLAKAKTIRGISIKIIEFLSQIEEFQKRLFEKKKFVLKTDYCITLDLIPEELYEEIWRNKKQVEEWKNLFKLDDTTQDTSYSTVGKTTLSAKVLKEHKHLVLDTQFFDQDFKDKLIACFDDLDEIIEGIIIKSENYQALCLLQNKYQEKVKCVYIDPPYNSKSTEILYPNNYKHSSWLALIENRLALSKYFSTPDGSHIIAIDENEQERLGLLLSTIFPRHQRSCVSVIHNKKGIQGDRFSYNHDYAYFCIPTELEKINQKLIPQVDWEYDNLRKWGSESKRSTAKNCFYPIIVENGEIIDFGDVCPDSFHPMNNNMKQKDGSIEVYPIDSKGVERKWRYARGSVERINHLLKVHITNRGEVQIHKAKDLLQYKTVWDDPIYIAGDYGTRLLTEMGIFPEQGIFPKSIHTVYDSIHAVSDNQSIVLDYFAGSGTTAHAVIELNHQDNGNRKYILVEIGDWFETVLKPRIQKVMYSKTWKKGLPDSTQGTSHIFKYIYLEQYEDTLNNILFISPDGSIQQTLERFPDYFISYMLDYETRDSPTRLSIEQFKTPFNYKIKTLSGGEELEKSVDLVETFNYLLGLHVKRIRAYKDGDRVYRAIFGERDYEQVAVIWRDTSDLDLELDKKFIELNILAGSNFDTIYVNGDSYIRGAKPIEPEFRRLMDA